MKLEKAEKLLRDMGACERELLLKMLIEAENQFLAEDKVHLGKIYETIAIQMGLTSVGTAERRIKNALDLLGFRGNIEVVVKVFGQNYCERIHITPTRFVYMMLKAAC